MKKITLLLLLAFSNFTFSQINDLATLSSGTYLSFNPLFNNDEQLFGYFALFDKGNDSKTTKKFEYVYLDKNLNKVGNNVFSSEDFVAGYSSFINRNGHIELKPRFEYGINVTKKINKSILPKRRVIDVKNNTITNKEGVCFEDSKIVDCEDQTLGEMNKEQKKEFKKNGFNYKSDVIIMNDGTYLVYEFSYKSTVSDPFNCAFIKFDNNKAEVWRYEFNKDMNKKETQKISVLYFDDNYLYLIESTYLKKTKIFKLIKIDLITGERFIDEEIKGYSQYSLNSLEGLIQNDYYITNKKEFDDNLIFVGKTFDKKNEFCTGFFRVIIDKKTHKVSYTNMPFISASPFLKDINEKGIVEKGYNLSIRDLHILKDGSIGFLFEKFKVGWSFSDGQVIKTTDLVYFSTDKDLKIKSINTFSKDKSKGYYVSDYLFSQYINDGNDVAFFYKDFQKDQKGDRNWNLFINTIKNGEFSQEKIPMTSKENTIVPYIAKEGYILLREFNKKSKYDGIRLERLNY